MAQLTLASLFLPMSHFLISSTSLREALIERLGEGRYYRAYSALAAVALFWLAAAYWQAPAVPLWTAPCAVRLALTPLILVASVLAVAGVMTPNPVIVRSERLFDRSDAVRGLLRITRNPFFWGVGLIAVTHIVLIGSLAAILAFGSLAVLGFAGAPVLDAKKAKRHGRAWELFASATSDIPFLAVAQGRQQLAWREIGYRRIGFGMALFLVALACHPALFGTALWR